MVESGLVDIAFLVDAHCGPVDIQKCQAYTRSMGNVVTKGAPDRNAWEIDLPERIFETRPHGGQAIRGAVLR